MNSFKDKIVIEGIVVDVVRKDIKNLHLRVRPPKGTVDVTVPYRISNCAIRSFIVSKLDWIKKHQIKIQDLRNQLELKYVSGENHLFQGKSYPLKIIYRDAAPRVEIRDNAYIDLYVRPDSNQLQREKAINDWYRSSLKEKVPPLVVKWRYIIAVELTAWGIKKMKTRWGSCNQRDKRIWLNLELAKKPLHCLEFIIVHELTHLLERRHNNHFKGLMDNFMPDWRHYKEELNRIAAPDREGSDHLTQVSELMSDNAC
ncbi:MAG: SprT family zinc-dependent metalloprotease [Pseudomonadota bacterium]